MVVVVVVVVVPRGAARRPVMREKKEGFVRVFVTGTARRWEVLILVCLGVVGLVGLVVVVGGSGWLW